MKIIMRFIELIIVLLRSINVQAKDEKTKISNVTRIYYGGKSLTFNGTYFFKGFIISKLSICYANM